MSTSEETERQRLLDEIEALAARPRARARALRTGGLKRASKPDDQELVQITCNRCGKTMARVVRSADGKLVLVRFWREHNLGRDPANTFERGVRTPERDPLDMVFLERVRARRTDAGLKVTGAFCECEQRGSKLAPLWIDYRQLDHHLRRAHQAATGRVRWEVTDADREVSEIHARMATGPTPDPLELVRALEVALR